jgi:hypothetical protein
MSWLICSRNGALADAGSRRTARNGDKLVAIWESQTKRVVTICRSRRKVCRRAMFIVARIAKKNFRACAAFAARLRVSPVVENITEAISIRGFG